MNIESTKKSALAVAKAGRSPWWPSEVLGTEDEEQRKVHVAFLGVGQRAWVGEGDLVRARTRGELESYLEDKRKVDGENLKYTNNIPETIRESYDNAWNLYEDLMKLESEERCTEYDMYLGEDTCKEREVTCVNVPCEICVKKVIEKECGPANSNLLSLSEQNRNLKLSAIMTCGSDDVIQCDNQCVWKYHRRCVTSDNDFVCSCNKSSWKCSVCEETVTVSEMFICDNYECMRAFHKTCISAHLDLQPDIKQCPLHQCINCRLDGLSYTEDSSLTYCIKCKIGFHNNSECLPSVYIPVTDKYIICGRHLLDLGTLRSTCADFCFYCLGSTNGTVSVSCSFCLITYHNSSACLPSWLDVSTNDHSFICHGCKFPLVRRSKYMTLSPPSCSKAQDVNAWRIGLCEGSHDFKTILLNDIHNNSSYRESLYNIISINLQSLDHLVYFGFFRFSDMQDTVRHMSSIVNSLTSINTKIINTYRRNGFVLLYSSLFPIVNNVYDKPQNCEYKTGSSMKCTCTDYCSTTKCYNVAANIECNEDNCNSLTRCRNRRFQKRLFPRQRLITGEDLGRPCVVLEEAVVKDVLVTELVGQIKIKPYKDVSKHGTNMFILSDEFVIDNARYCNISRFIHHNDWPNLISKVWTVSGSKRLGLFSCRRIAADETLTVDMNLLLLGRKVSSREPLSMNLIPWSEFIVHDIGDEYFSNTNVIDLSLESNYAGDNVTDDYHPSLRGRPLLCPVCLKELIPDYSIFRSLIHCVNCYTVHHLRCASSSFTLVRTPCRVEKDPRLMRFVCNLCRLITDD